jgi:hypothetical protein
MTLKANQVPGRVSESRRNFLPTPSVISGLAAEIVDQSSSIAATGRHLAREQDPA